MKLSKIRQVGRFSLLVFLFSLSGPLLEKLFAAHPAARSAVEASGSNPILLLFSLLLFACAITGTLRGLVPMLDLLVREKWLLLLYLVANLSVLWSQEPATALHEVVFVDAYFLCACYLCVHFDLAMMLRYLRTIYATLAVLSIPGQFLLPTMRDPRDVPGWEGVFTHKNVLGISMVIGLGLTLLNKEKPWSSLRVLLCALYVFLLIMSKSTTSILCAVLLVGCLLCLRLKREAKAAFVVIAMSLITLGYVASQTVAAEFLATSGKDTTLTGRTEIWAFAERGIAAHPLLGSGFGTFWLVNDSVAVQALGWNPGQAHNTYLQALLDVGLIGLCFALLAVLSAMRRGVRIARLGQPDQGFWLIVLGVILLFQGISEANLLVRGVVWIVFLLSSMSAQRTLEQLQVRQRVVSNRERLLNMGHGLRGDPA